MKILLKNATVLDPSSPFHSNHQDILINSGVITQIANKIKSDKDTQVFTSENLHVSCGWFDSGVSFGEPGYEERETLSNGLEVAARSGFTKIVVSESRFRGLQNLFRLLVILSGKNYVLRHFTFNLILFPVFYMAHYFSFLM